jgi:hypothetical protein
MARRRCLQARRRTIIERNVELASAPAKSSVNQRKRPGYCSRNIEAFAALCPRERTTPPPSIIFDYYSSNTGPATRMLGANPRAKRGRGQRAG